MGTEFFGVLSGTCVFVSAIPYVIGVCKGKIATNFATWSLWTVIGLAILLTYYSSGARDNIWPAVFGFTNPLLIMVIMIRKRHAKEDRELRSLHATCVLLWKELKSYERTCLGLGIATLLLWLVAQRIPSLATIALSTAILSDFCAAIPTIIFLWRNPAEDRPFAWTLFVIGYALSFGAIPNWGIANIVVPIYMVVTGLAIALPLILQRIRADAPLLDWI